MGATSACTAASSLFARTLSTFPLASVEFGNPVSIGFHRLAVDTTGAITYLNPKTGLELSGAVGVTLNVENGDTNYKTGTEVHFEWAAMKHLSHTASVGLHGYAYKQIGGDSGSGALLGPFKGRVFAIGPAVDYTFKIGKTPVVANLRYLHEFGVENRMKGDVGFLTWRSRLALPLPQLTDVRATSRSACPMSAMGRKRT